MTLIEQLEQLMAPSRRLDIEIELAVFGDKPYGFKGPYAAPKPCTLREWFTEWGDTASNDVADDAVPRYTSSIDAALKLRLPGHTYALGDCSEDDAPWATATSPACIDFTGSAFNEATSLTIAWLKARAPNEHGVFNV